MSFFAEETSNHKQIVDFGDNVNLFVPKPIVDPFVAIDLLVHGQCFLYGCAGCFGCY